MMKKIKTYIFFVISLSLFSCFNSKTEKALKTVDSLLVVVKNIDTTYQSIDFKTLKLVYDTIKQDIDSLGKHMVNFPENKEWENALSIYQDAAKDAKHLFKRKYKNDIFFSIKQLNNLKIDINNNAVEKDSLLIYINSEKEAINILKERINNQYNTSSRILDRYNRSKPFVNLFIDSLITANNKQ